MPLAWIIEFGAKFGRIWAHARLANKLKQQINPSTVVLACPQIIGGERIKLGKNLYLWPDLYWETQNTGKIEIADDVVMSRGVHLVAFEHIYIGKGSMIGEYSSIRDANHRIGGEQLRDAGHVSAAIHIGKQVWIGRGVCILPGVSIGDYAVIGANAVVTKDIPAASVAVGIPARVIKQL